MNDRRKADRRMPPAVAQHAIEERAELLVRVEEQAREIDRLKRSAQTNWNEFAEGMKSQPGGVVLPEPFEMRPFQTVDQGSTNYKAGFNAALRKVSEIPNSHPVSAGGVYSADPLACSGCVSGCVRCRVSTGVVDERSAESIAKMVIEWVDSGQSMSLDWRPGLANVISKRLARFAALTAQPDHSAQSLNMVPDGWKLVPVEPTAEMIASVAKYDREYFQPSWAGTWREFLAAAPAPGKQEG